MDSLPSIAYRIIRDISEISDVATLEKLIARNVAQAEYFEDQSEESGLEDLAIQHRDAADVLGKFLRKKKS